MFIAGALTTPLGYSSNLFAQVCDQRRHRFPIGLEFMRAGIDLGFNLRHSLFSELSGNDDTLDIAAAFINL